MASDNYDHVHKLGEVVCEIESGVITIGEGENRLLYQIKEKKIHFFKIPLNTSFEIKYAVDPSFPSFNFDFPLVNEFSYDDILDRELNIAAPCLEKYNFKNQPGSYKSTTTRDTFEEIKAILPRGVEVLLVEHALRGNS